MMSFDYAIELLEITDIKSVNIENLPKLLKKAKRRWHPDTISHLNNAALTEEYTRKFQEVEAAGNIISNYLSGGHTAGEAFKSDSYKNNHAPEDIIRENAHDLQSELKTFYDKAKVHKYMFTQEDVQLSDGFRLADLIQNDYDDDVVSKAFISLSYGGLFLLVISLLMSAWKPQLAPVGAILLLIHFIACFLALLPLVRFWLNNTLLNVVMWIVNFGLSIYVFILNRARNTNNLIWFTVSAPLIISKIIKYLIVWPLTQISKLIVGNKIVGVVYSKSNFYAGLADWYIEKLVGTPPSGLSTEELFDLSSAHSNLKDVSSI